MQEIGANSERDQELSISTSSTIDPLKRRISRTIPYHIGFDRLKAVSSMRPGFDRLMRSV